MAITAGITHRRVSQAGLLHQPGPREEPLPRPVLPAELLPRPGHQAGPPRRPVLPAELLHQPGRRAEPLLPHALQHRHQHQPDLLLPLPDQIILLHRHPDPWGHLLTEEEPPEAEVIAEAVELPEVAAVVAGDANRLYNC